MADNISVKDGAGATVVVAAKDVSSVFVPASTPVTPANVTMVGTLASPAAGAMTVVPPQTTEVSTTFNRASNTTTYTANDLVNASAAGATGATVSAVIAAGRGVLRRVTLRHNASGSTGFNSATFRVHIFDANITPTTNVGDNDVFSEPIADKIGFVDIVCSDVGAADGQKGYQACDIPFVAGTLYYLVQILTGWTTPTASATFVVDFDYVPG